jgi:hypothetical protein
MQEIEFGLAEPLQDRGFLKPESLTAQIPGIAAVPGLDRFIGSVGALGSGSDSVRHPAHRGNGDALVLDLEFIH